MIRFEAQLFRPQNVQLISVFPAPLKPLSQLLQREVIQPEAAKDGTG